MDELTTLRYSISKGMRENVNMYNIQKDFFENKGETQFNECRWLASHTEYFQNATKVFTNKLQPKSVILSHDNKDYVIIKGFEVQPLSLLKFILTQEDKTIIFDSDGYFKLYEKTISMYFDEESIDTAKFFCQYGFWNGLLPAIINPYVVVASNVDKYLSFEDTEEYRLQVLDDYFKDSTMKYDFDVYEFVACNYDETKEYLDKLGKVDETRVIKHYMRNILKYTNTKFDVYEYLANNIKVAKEIMSRNKKNQVCWDFYKLTTRNVCKAFLKHYGKRETNVFQEVKFVKAFCDDQNFVNKNRKLCLENSAEYFVKAYVKLEEVRYKYTLWYRFLTLAQGRLFDAIKQVPYNASRFVIQTQCF